MHFGATLRLLRLESGVGLRDLARRLNVSGAYLSRVENGLDAAPTPARLEAIAKALDIPAPLLLDLAHRVSPLVVDYVDQVPEAGTLFLEIAHRRLTAPQLAQLRTWLNQQFPAANRNPVPLSPRVSDLLTPARIIVGFSGASIDDVFDIAAGRLPSPTTPDVYSLAAEWKRREREVSSGIGSGVAVRCAYTLGTSHAAVLVTLARPLRHDTPDKEALRVVIVLAGPRNSTGHRIRLAHVARLASRGLCDHLAELESPAQVLSRLALLEALA